MLSLQGFAEFELACLRGEPLPRPEHLPLFVADLFHWCAQPADDSINPQWLQALRLSINGSLLEWRLRSKLHAPPNHHELHISHGHRPQPF